MDWEIYRCVRDQAFDAVLADEGLGGCNVVGISGSESNLVHATLRSVREVLAWNRHGACQR